VTLTALLIPS